MDELDNLVIIEAAKRCLKGLEELWGMPFDEWKNKRDREEQERKRREEQELKMLAKFLCGVLLKKLRLDLRFTQNEMARKLKISSRSYYSQIESQLESFPTASMPLFLTLFQQSQSEQKKSALYDANKFEVLQQQLGLSGAAIARRLGISRMTWSLWRRGKTTPRNKRQKIIKIIENLWAEIM